MNALYNAAYGLATFALSLGAALLKRADEQCAAWADVTAEDET